MHLHGRLEAGDIIVKVDSTSTYRTTTSKLSFGKGNDQLTLGIYTRKEEARPCLDLEREKALFAVHTDACIARCRGHDLRQADVNLIGRHFTDDDEEGIEFKVDDVFYDETGNNVLAKYWDTTTDKPEDDCEFDYILTSELRFGWGMRLVTEEQQLPQYELSEIEIRRATNIRRNREFLDQVH